MSFWQTSDGANASQVGNEFESAGGGGVIIPDNSSVLAYIKDAGIKQDDNFQKFYFIDWSVLKPEEVKGAFIRQKLWLIDPKPGAKDQSKARDTAIRMLGAIDTNSGGKLATLQGAPTDEQMKIALVNKQMVIKTKIWSMGGGEGNWVCAVSPKTKEVELTGKPRAQQSKPQEQKADDGWGAPNGGGNGFGDDDDSESIPF